MQDLLESWAEEVAKAMAEKFPPMTPTELAKRCGVSTSTITRFLTADKVTGMRRNVSDRLKYDIAGALGKRMDKLFFYPAVIPPAPAMDEVA